MMKVLAISDLHGYLPEIPACDLLLLGGDYCPTRNLDQQRRFLTGEFTDWLNKIPARYIVGIGGNHDFILQEDRSINEYIPWVYLQDELVEIESVRIYGSPWTLPYFDWAFMKPEYELRDLYVNIPKNLDILLTHGPSYRHLDKTSGGVLSGSFSLHETIQRVKPDSHVFGHIHEAHGIMDEGKTRYYNVSYVENVWKPHPHYEPKHTPINVTLRMNG
jgi:Icc-related predicted phosphoesterase